MRFQNVFDSAMVLLGKSLILGLFDLFKRSFFLSQNSKLKKKLFFKESPKGF